jgi:tRNA(Ile)-lysidine synthase
VVLARRVERAEAALNRAFRDAQIRLAPGPWPDHGPVSIEASAFLDLPEEIALRLLGWAIAVTGDEGPVELGKLEAANFALSRAIAPALPRLKNSGKFRRTLAGAVVTLTKGRIWIERAPQRRSRASKRP